jgi:phage terminase large subunit
MRYLIFVFILLGCSSLEIDETIKDIEDAIVYVVCIEEAIDASNCEEDINELKECEDAGDMLDQAICAERVIDKSTCDDIDDLVRECKPD